MTTKQQNKLSMYLAVKAVLDAASSIWQPLPAFAEGHTDFTTHLSNIQTLGQNQMMDTTGITQDKQAAHKTMCQTAIGLAQAVRAYAMKNQNHTLAGSVDFTITDLLHERDNQSAEDCQNIHDIAETNLANLANFGVTAAKLTTLQTAIDAFNAIIQKPRQTIAQGKTVTQQLSDEFTATDLTLDEGLDNLIGQFAGTDAKFVSDYKNARSIVDAAASHNSITPPTPPPVTPKA